MIYFRTLAILCQLVFEARSNLLLEKLDDPLVWKGSYILEVKLSVTELLRISETLDSAVQNYNETCRLLTKKIPKTQCNLMIQDLEYTVKRGEEMEQFIRGFFPSRKTRGFLTWIGAMDSDDRARVDKNVDTLRKNEESLKNSINHQTSTVDAMYKFIDNSMLRIDDRIKKVSDNFNKLEQIVEGNLNFTNSIKNIVYLESELLEIGFRIQSLTESIKYYQNIIIQILLTKTQGMTWVIQLIEPSHIFSLLERAKSSLPKDVIFPKKKLNGEIISEILNLIELSWETMNNEILILKLKIPLVLKQTFVAYKGITLPQINGTLVALIGLDKNILIQEVDRDWGFVIPESTYNQCQRFTTYRICDFNSIEIGLNSEEECLLNLRFRNSSKNCKVRIVNITKDTWFATEDPNIWEYVTPYEIRINVFHGFNHSFMNIKGNGKINLIPGMMIISNFTKLTYTNITIFDSTAYIYTHTTKKLNFTLDTWETLMVPTLKENKSLYSIYDHKKLFELGVDIEDLKNSKPVLENMIYSPLSSPWTIYSLSAGTVIILIIIIISFICCFKGNISCHKEYHTKTPSRYNKSDILHLGVINNPHKIVQDNQNTRKSSQCSTGLKTEQKLSVHKSRDLPALPIIGEKEEYYLEAYLELPEHTKKLSLQSKITDNKINNKNLRHSTMQRGAPLRRTVNY